MKSKRALLIASACLLPILTGCETSGGKVTLAPIPGDLATCFSQIVPAPPRGAMSARQVARMIADLKKSEAAKSACGKRLIAFYEAQATVYAKGK